MKISRFISFPVILIIAFCFLQACGGEDPLSVSFEKVPPPYDRSKAVQDTVLPSGIEIYIIEEGDGQFQVTYKDQIVVKFTGRTAEGEIFDSSFARFSDKDTDFTARFLNLYPYPITIQTPAGSISQTPLIEGLRKGLYGMVPGEKRIIVVPPEKGQRRGIKNGINLNGKTLVYNVELVKILGVAREIL